MAQILFFGSSSVQGVGDPEGGWVDRFKREMHRQAYGGSQGGTRNEVFNLGIRGDTSSQILQRLPYELPARQIPGQPLVVVLNSGTNDSRAEDSPTNFVFNVQEYMVTMQNIIEFTRSYTSNIVLIGLTPIDDTHTRPMPDNMYFSQARVQEFDEAMTEVARSNHLPKIELYASMLALDWRAMLYEDGLHLNNMGHEWLYQRIRQPLMNVVQQAR